MRTALAAMIGWLHGCIAAFQFLTRLPIPVQITYTERVFRRSVVFYPLAGLVIGVIVALAGQGLIHALPALPAAALLLALWVGLTGGLHLDGLMDTADGLLSHRPREQMLEIMKDSRVGAMGAIVCALHLLVKFSLLYTLLDAQAAGGAALLAVVPVWSRWFMAAAMYGWPYARQESGLGGLFRGVGLRHAAAGALLAGGLTWTALAVGPGSPAGASSLALTLAAALLTLAVGCSMAALISRKLGGLTGDTYGAMNELVESVLLLATVVIIL